MRVRAPLFVRTIALLFALPVVGSAGCSTDVTGPAEPPACGEPCKDEIAIKALREMAKLAFNVNLQGKPVGSHDVTSPCPQGGSVRIVGTATSNADQGSTEVDLTYTFTDCGYIVEDDDPEDNYEMTIGGVLRQTGTLAVQPTATTALILRSDAITFRGNVYDPPLDYAATCPIALGQNGNRLSGKICDRTTGVDL